MTASLKVKIYEIEYKQKIFSVLRFVSAINLIDPEMKKLAQPRGVDDAVELELKPDEDVLIIQPSGSLRPYFTYNDAPTSFEENCESITSLGEFLFFQKDSKTLQSLLDIALVKKSGDTYNLNLSFEHLPAVELEILPKMIRRWKMHILQRLSLYQQQISVETLMSYEKLKLIQSLSLMKTMLENGISGQVREIESINNPTPIQNRALRLQLKYLVFQCEKAISDVFDKFSKGETECFEKMFEDVDDSLKEFLKICRARPKVSDMKKFFDSRFDENDELTFIKIAESIKEKLKNQIIGGLKEDIVNNECAKTRNSVIGDLCDPLLYKVLYLGKFLFLNSFTLTGIPISLSDKDLSEMTYIENPWGLRVKVIFYAGDGGIKNKKRTVLSNVLLDDAENQTETRTRSYELMNGKKFNAIVPVFTPKVVNILKPLLHTRVFESLCTYTILKNPHTIEPYAHFAGLLVLFIEIIKKIISVDVDKSKYINDAHDDENVDDDDAAADNDDDDEDEDEDEDDNEGDDRLLDLREELKSVIATAGAYLELSNFRVYQSTLINSPHLALREKSSAPDNFQIQSENLVKPLFYLYLHRNELALKKKNEILYLIVLQFIDRMVSALLRNNPEIDVKIHLFKLFCNFQQNDGRKPLYEESISKKYDRLIELLFEEFKKERGVDNFPIGDEMIRVEDTLRRFSDKLYSDIEVDFNEKFLYDYQDKERIGAFNLIDLRKIALEQLNFSNEDVNRIFDVKNLFCFTYHCLTVPKQKYGTRLLENVRIYPFKEYYWRAIRDVHEYVSKRAIKGAMLRLQNAEVTKF